MTRVGDIARSGLSVATARVGRSAHNVANVNTDGFKAERVVSEEAENGGATYTSTPVETPAPTYERDGRQVTGSNTDLVDETVEQIGGANAFKANLAVLKTDEEMQRTLIDMKA
jgi:flagellar basal body rod protein FlgG